jgi:hypothetical protein
MAGFPSGINSQTAPATRALLGIVSGPGGLPMLTAGHSWENGGGVFQKDYNRDKNYVQRLQANFGGILGDFSQWAVIGSLVTKDDTAGTLLGGTPFNAGGQAVHQGGWASLAQMIAPVVGQGLTNTRNQPGVTDASTSPAYDQYDAIARGLQIIGGWIENNVGVSNTTFGDNTLTTGQSSYKNAMRFVLSILRAAVVYFDNDASLVYSNAARVLQTTSNLGSGITRAVANSSVTLTLPADFQGGTVAIGFRFPQGRAAGSGLTFGGTASTIPSPVVNPNNNWSGSLLLLDSSLISQAGTQTAIPVCVRVTLQASDAGKTIVMTTANPGSVDVMGWWVEAPTGRAPLQLVRNGALIGGSQASTLAVGGTNCLTGGVGTGTQGVATTANFVPLGTFNLVLASGEQCTAAVLNATTLTISARATNGTAAAAQAAGSAVVGSAYNTYNVGLWLNAFGTGGGGQVTQTAYQAIISAFNGYLATICAEFDSHTLLVDMSQTFNNAQTYLQLMGDGSPIPAHPNAYGALTLATLFQQAFIAAGYSAADLQPSARTSNAPLPHILPGGWLEPPGTFVASTLAGSTGLITLGQHVAYQWEAPDDIIIIGAGIEITVLGVASTLNIGIYDDYENSYWPQYLLGYGTIPTTAATGFQVTPSAWPTPSGAINAGGSLYVPMRRGVKFWTSYLATGTTGPTVRTFVPDIPSKSRPVQLNPPGVQIAGPPIQYMGYLITAQAQPPAASFHIGAVPAGTSAAAALTTGLPRVYLQYLKAA